MKELSYNVLGDAIVDGITACSKACGSTVSTHIDELGDLTITGFTGCRTGSAMGWVILLEPSSQLKLDLEEAGKKDIL